MKNNRHKFLFFSIFIIIILICSFPVLPVKATSSYNWIQNSGFEDTAGIELISNGNFESGSLSDGWSVGSGSPSIITTAYFSATHALSLTSSSVWYNFTEAVPVGNIANFTFYARGSATTTTLNYYYTDETSGGGAITFGTANVTGDDGAQWSKIDVKALYSFAEGKVLKAFRVTGVTVKSYDDFSMTSTIHGQTEIGLNTSPWYDADILGTDTAQAITENVSYSHSGSYSLRLQFYQQIVKVKQNINYLNTSLITSVGYWVKCDGEGGESAQFAYTYSDGTYSQKSISFTSYNQWTYLDFTSELDTNKLLIRISITLDGGILYPPQYVYIDDVVLYASVPLSTKFFEWSMIPDPIEITRNPIGFIQLYGIGETITCKVYDYDGECTESGDYSVDTSFETLTGSVENGIFSFSLSARSGVTNATESLVISVVLTERSFTVVLIAEWWIITSAGIGGEGYDTWYSNIIVNFMVMFIFIFVPPLFLAFEFSKHGVSPTLGFVGGLILTTGIGYQVGIVPLWFLFLIVFFIIIVFIDMLHSRGVF